MAATALRRCAALSSTSPGRYVPSLSLRASTDSVCAFCCTARFARRPSPGLVCLPSSAHLSAVNAAALPSFWFPLPALDPGRLPPRPPPPLRQPSFSAAFPLYTCARPPPAVGRSGAFPPLLPFSLFRSRIVPPPLDMLANLLGSRRALTFP